MHLRHPDGHVFGIGRGFEPSVELAAAPGQ